MNKVVEFFNEIRRMCDEHGNCDECLISFDCRRQLCDVDAEYVVDAVKQWGAEHPVRTNRIVMEDVFGMGIESDLLQTAEGAGRLTELETWLDSPYQKPGTPSNGEAP